MSIILILTLILTIHYSIFILNIHRGIKRVSEEELSGSKNYKVSLIIPFRNEEEVIHNVVESVNNLMYPQSQLEVIFVDDFSTDSSPQIVRELIKIENWKLLQPSSQNQLNSYKKSAITLAIQHSVGEIIVLTDADCKLPPEWLNVMMSKFDDDTAMVSGPVVFEEESTLFQKLQKLEHAGLVLTGAGLIGNGTPTICSSANLAFKKNVFAEVDGFEGNLKLASGDDEFLMQKIAARTNYKIKYCFNRKSLVLTRSNKNLSEFSNQRKRWASKGFHYANKSLVIKLFLIFGFYLLLATIPVLAVLYGPNFVIAFVIMLIGKFVPEYFVIKNGSEFLFPKTLLRYFFIAEILHVPYIIYSVIGGTLGGFVWKGRNLRR